MLISATSEAQPALRTSCRITATTGALSRGRSLPSRHALVDLERPLLEPIRRSVEHPVSATAHAYASGIEQDPYAIARARLRMMRRRRAARRHQPDRRPLDEAYRRRKERQSALREGRNERALRRMAERNRQEAPTPTLDTIAAMEGVPVWALEVAQEITGHSNVAAYAERHPTRSTLVAD
jgi:hypothetical protein